MTRKEIERAREYINSQIASANGWHDRMLSLDGRIDAAEDAGDMEKAAKLERLQDMAAENRDRDIATARAALRLVSVMGYRPIYEEYERGREYDPVWEFEQEDLYY